MKIDIFKTVIKFYIVEIVYLSMLFYIKVYVVRGEVAKCQK